MNIFITALYMAKSKKSSKSTEKTTVEPKTTESSATTASTTPEPATAETIAAETIERAPTAPETTEKKIENKPPIERNEVPEKKGKPLLLIAMIGFGIILFLCLAVFALWYFLVRDNDSDKDKNGNKPDDTAECTFDAELVEDIAIENSSDISAQDEFTKTWRVKNIGTCEWDKDVELAFVSGDSIEQGQTEDIINTKKDESINVSVNLTAPSVAGTYQAIWKLTDNEGSEFGDPLPLAVVVKAPVVVPEKADLIVTSVKTEPAEVRQGSPIKVIAKVKNQGGTNAVGFKVSWRTATSPASPVKEFPGTITLTPGQETTLQLDYTYQGWSTYTTQVKVDIENKVSESNEDNNTRDLVVAVQEGLADVIVESITYNPTTPVSGEFTLITIVYKNVGYKDINQDMTLKWWQSASAPNPGCEQVVEGVAAGESKSTLCFYVFPSWYNNISTRAEIDTANVAVEGNETNNTTTKIIDVAAP